MPIKRCMAAGNVQRFPVQSNNNNNNKNNNNRKRGRGPAPEPQNVAEIAAAFNGQLLRAKVSLGHVKCQCLATVVSSALRQLAGY